MRSKSASRAFWRRELRDLRLEQAARLEHARDLGQAHVGLLAQQLDRHVARRHEDPAGRARMDLEHARLLQHLDRLAQRRAADPHRLGQLALARQPVALGELAVADPLRDLLDRALEGPSRADRLEVHAVTVA